MRIRTFQAKNINGVNAIVIDGKPFLWQIDPKFLDDVQTALIINRHCPDLRKRWENVLKQQFLENLGMHLKRVVTIKDILVALESGFIENMMVFEETDERFYIAKSILPYAGLGVFAKVKLPQNSFIEVTGVAVKVGGLAEQCTHYADAYTFGAAGNLRIIPLGFAGIINHTNDSKLQNAELIRLLDHKPSQHALDVVYRFIRDIEPGEEIIGHYGEKRGEQVQEECDWYTFLSYDFYGMKRLLFRN